MDTTYLTPILNVSDLQESFAWFLRLGWEKRWDWGDPPDFGAVGSGGYEIFLCEDGQGGRGDAGVWLAIFVDDADAVHHRCLEQGIEVLMPPTDQPWNLREMFVRHPDGHVLRIGHGLGNGEHGRDHGPPLEIERVDVPVRLEKRIAGVLRDLAESKGMSVDSCLEETLLHTFEQVGGGVASPHTVEQLRHIRELKRKHGIDYDSHASYRFVERGGV